MAEQLFERMVSHKPDRCPLSLRRCVGVFAGPIFLNTIKHSLHSLTVA